MPPALGGKHKNPRRIQEEYKKNPRKTSMNNPRIMQEDFKKTPKRFQEASKAEKMNEKFTRKYENGIYNCDGLAENLTSLLGLPCFVAITST